MSDTNLHRWNTNTH